MVRKRLVDIKIALLFRHYGCTFAGSLEAHQELEAQHRTAFIDA